MSQRPSQWAPDHPERQSPLAVGEALMGDYFALVRYLNLEER